MSGHGGHFFIVLGKTKENFYKAFQAPFHLSLVKVGLVVSEELKKM